MKPSLTIGHFPIIDHLILGVAVHNDSSQYKHFTLRTKLFTDWPAISEALETGAIDGAFVLFPLAFELFRRGLKSHLVLLGHREGQILIAKKGITKVEELKGKTVFVPDKYSTHHILLCLALRQAGLTLDDVKIQMGFSHPREMVSMLEEGKIDAFVSAEPMGSEAVEKGVGNVLKLSHDISAHHVDCVFVVRDDLINKNSSSVEEFVSSLVKAGLFINAYPRQAAEIGELFLGWPQKLLLRALTHDRAHILFWDLLPRIEEFAELQDIAVEEMHLWDTGIDLETFIEPKFAQAAYREWVIDTRREVKDRGRERNLPGNFREAADRFQQLFSTSIPIAGLRFIASGEAYPKGTERLKEISELRREFLEDVFAGHAYSITTPYAKKKALSFFVPENGSEPDRVLFKLTHEEALKVLQALEWGERLAEVKKYSEATADRDLFSSTGSISAVQDEIHVYFSIDLTVFRFLVLLLHYF